MGMRDEGRRRKITGNEKGRGAAARAEWVGENLIQFPALLSHSP